MRCCATCWAIAILRSAMCRRSTTISAPAMFVIRKPTSRRRRDCWGTTQRTTSVPGSAKHYRGMNPARSSPPAGERRRCPMCAAIPDRRRRSARRPRPRCLGVAGLAFVGLALAAAANGSDGVADRDVADTGAVTAPSVLIAQARAYENGEGVPKEPLKAAALYCAAARTGDAEAQFSLGWMYANGRGVAHDDAVAASLFALAAAAGHAEAGRMLRFVGDPAGALPDCMRPPEPPPGAPAAVAELDPDPFAALPPWK